MLRRVVPLFPVALLSAIVYAKGDGELTGKVISVVDGETITILSGNDNVTVRPEWIDAPEKKQAFGINQKRRWQHWSRARRSQLKRPERTSTAAHWERFT